MGKDLTTIINKVDEGLLLAFEYAGIDFEGNPAFYDSEIKERMSKLDGLVKELANWYSKNNDFFKNLQKEISDNNKSSSSGLASSIKESLSKIVNKEPTKEEIEQTTELIKAGINQYSELNKTVKQYLSLLTKVYSGINLTEQYLGIVESYFLSKKESLYKSLRKGHELLTNKKALEQWVDEELKKRGEYSLDDESKQRLKIDIKMSLQDEIVSYAKSYIEVTQDLKKMVDYTNNYFNPLKDHLKHAIVLTIPLYDKLNEDFTSLKLLGTVLPLYADKGGSFIEKVNDFLQESKEVFEEHNKIINYCLGELEKSALKQAFSPDNPFPGIEKNPLLAGLMKNVYGPKDKK